MGKVMPNEQQRKVVEAIAGPVLISAGLGTGKTATLVNRYAKIEEGISEGNQGGAY